MNLEKITDQILYFKCDSQKELVLTFCRIQEFYESPHERIRGRRFDFYEFLEAYTGNMGRFSYFTDWGGFNFPSDVYENWLLTSPNVSAAEEKLAKAIAANRPIKRKNSLKHLLPFYVISSCDNDRTKDHEIAHAMYFLDESYRIAAKDSMDDVPLYNKMTKVLGKLGYDASVFEDEVNAYLSTSDNKYLHKLFKLTPKECTKADKLRRLFKMNKKAMGIPNARTHRKNRRHT